MGLLDGYFGLGLDINKVRQNPEDETLEGVVSSEVPELELSITDDELIELKNTWEKDWSQFSDDLSREQLDAENYWLGKQYATKSQNEGHALVDNIIFESLETFLPMATRQRAEPVVDSDGTEVGNALADTVRKVLMKKSDDMALNLKMKQVARYWALYKVGVAKIGWSYKMDDFVIQTIRPQKLILDPDATVSECEYTGEYVGEYKKDTAKNLITRFPKQKQYIKDLVKDKLGTKIQYIEWWTDEYVFWTLNDVVLAKAKNPHWNYEGRNHFKLPQKPYVFMSVFNIGLHPVDDTTLVLQNLPVQDLVNKRLRQIDKNADNFANSTVLVSGDQFTKEQATNVAKARQKGGAIFVPTGPVRSAVDIVEGSAIPSFVYESLLDYRNELRNIFGTRGSTPQGTIGEQTVRGKMIVKGQDDSRIGGGVSTYLEQFADRIFNWMVQMMVVYYDEPHTAMVVGVERAKEFVEISKADFVADLTIGVKEGSMIPRDPLTQRNEAIDLWAAGALDPITFFDRLEFPNPREAAKNLFLWKSDPIMLFPDLAEQMQQQQQPVEDKPNVSMNYKDLPPEGQIQMMQKAGIEIGQPIEQPMPEQQMI